MAGLNRMPRPYRVFQVDAFTTTPLTGNPAGVVADADGLSAATMQALARELNNPETAFVSAPTSTDHDHVVRYYTPTVEVPICGHATIAAHYVLARLGRRATGIVRQRSAAGVTEVEVIARGDGDYAVRMHQGVVRLEAPLSPRVARKVAGALGLTDDMVAPWPIQIAGSGHPKVIVSVTTRSALFTLKPDYEALAALSAEVGCNGFFCFTLDVADPGILTECRMFAPAIGIPEDPVTGNGNGPLGGYLVAHGLATPTEGRLVFWSSQGVTMRRPGRVRVSVTIDDAGDMHVDVGEHAVIVFETEVQL